MTAIYLDPMVSVKKPVSQPSIRSRSVYAGWTAFVYVRMTPQEIE